MLDILNVMLYFKCNPFLDRITRNWIRSLSAIEKTLKNVICSQFQHLILFKGILFSNVSTFWVK